MPSALDVVKKATCAIAALKQPPGQIQPSKEQPFEILGSGFCVHQDGVVITCSHVIELFMSVKIKTQLESIAPEERGKEFQKLSTPVSVIQPYALFFSAQPNSGQSGQVFIACVPVRTVVTPTDIDIAAVCVSPTPHFPAGFPTVEIADFDDVHEGLRVGICGFPTGNGLFQQLGTVSSSFSNGIVSSIVPAAGLQRQAIERFQLDVRATHGNSGGPVFGGIPAKYSPYSGKEPWMRTTSISMPAASRSTGR